MKRMCSVLAFLLVFGAVPVMAKYTPEWVRELNRLAPESATEDDEAALLLMDVRIWQEEHRMVVRYRKAYKILKLTGGDRGSITIFTSKNSPVEDIQGWKLDEGGKCVEKFDEDDVYRTAVSKGFVDDSMQLHAGFGRVYPGEVVCFEYTVRYFRYFRDMALFLGSADPVGTIRVELDDNVSAIVLNDPGNTVQRNGNILEIHNRPKLETEVNSVSVVDRLPQLAIHWDPELHKNWNTLGAYFWDHTGYARGWPSDLDTGLEIDKSADFKDVIQTVTDHVRKNTHNIGVELGTGAIVPREPGFVHEKAYGDCKDKTFYAMALLDSYGLKSYPFLCTPRPHGDVFPEFPAISQFNHCILAIPLPEESADLKNLEIEGRPWLLTDLTDSRTPIPLITETLEGTKGILIRDTGTTFVEVPWSSPEENVQRYELEMTYGADRTLTVSLVERLNGHLAVEEEKFRDGLAGKDQWEKYRSWIHGNVPGSRLDKFETFEEDGWQVTQVQFVVEDYGVAVNEELILVADVMSQGIENIYRPRTRTTPIQRDYPQKEEVDIRLTVDPVYTITEIPGEVDEENVDYILKQHSELDGNTAHIERTIVTRRTRIPVDEYKAFRNRYRKMLRLSKAPIRVKERKETAAAEKGEAGSSG